MRAAADQDLRVSICAGHQQLVGFTSRQPRSLLQHATRSSLLLRQTIAGPPGPGAACPVRQGEFVKHRRICLTLVSHLAFLLMVLRPVPWAGRSNAIRGTHPGSSTPADAGCPRPGALDPGVQRGHAVTHSKVQHQTAPAASGRWAAA